MQRSLSSVEITASHSRHAKDEGSPVAAAVPCLSNELELSVSKG